MDISKRLQSNKIKTTEISVDDVMKIIDEGQIITPKDKEKKPFLVFKVWFKGDYRDMSFNRKSLDALSEQWGTETKDWVGNWVECIIKDYVANYNAYSARFRPLTTARGKELDETLYIPKEGMNITKEDVSNVAKADVTSVKKNDEIIRPEDIDWE